MNIKSHHLAVALIVGGIVYVNALVFMGVFPGNKVGMFIDSICIFLLGLIAILTIKMQEVLKERQALINELVKNMQELDETLSRMIKRDE